MKKIIILVLILSTISLFAKTNRMIVLDFDNNSGIKKHNSLKKALADMLKVELKNIKDLSIIDRKKLSGSKYKNIKLGKALAANWILKGSFTTLKNQIRIDLNIIDVETGQVIDSVSVAGKSSKYFDLERKLVKKIIKAINTKEKRFNYIIDKQKKELKDFKVVLEYSNGVKLYDEGKFKEAKEAFKRAKKLNPDFHYADKYFKALEKKHNIGEDKYQRKLIEKAQKYEKEREKIERKFKKSLENRLKNTKAHIKYRKKDLEREQERRNKEIKNEKSKKLDKEILVLNKKIHKMRVKHHKKRINQGEKELKNLILNLKKNRLKSLIDKAEINWKYEEVRFFYKKLIKMKDLKDSEKLNCYKLMLSNYLQEAKYSPKMYKEAKSFYKGIEKYLDLNFYENKHIKSKTHLENIKTLKKSKHEKRIESLKEEETELKNLIKKAKSLKKTKKYYILEASYLKYKREKRNELNNEYKSLKKDIEDRLREFKRIERIIENLKRIKRAIK